MRAQPRARTHAHERRAHARTHAHARALTKAPAPPHTQKSLLYDLDPARADLPLRDPPPRPSSPPCIGGGAAAVGGCGAIRVAWAAIEAHPVGPAVARWAGEAARRREGRPAGARAAGAAGAGGAGRAGRPFESVPRGCDGTETPW